jgi:hypothetical protein
MREVLGDGALFAFYVCVWAAGFVAAAFVPRGTTSDRSADGAAEAGEAAAQDTASAGVVRGEARRGIRILSPGVLILIASPVVFYLANGGSWAFVGRVGTWTGLDDAQVGIALAAANVCAIVGGLVASWQGLRLRIVGPLVIGIMLTMSANLIMLGRWGMPGYTIANCIGFAFTIYTVSVYLQAFVYVDPSGRLMASGGLALYAGGALGPVILAQFIPAGDSPSYAAALIADSVVFVLAPVVFVIGWALVKRTLARGEAVTTQHTAGRLPATGPGAFG